MKNALILTLIMLSNVAAADCISLPEPEENIFYGLGRGATEAVAHDEARNAIVKQMKVDVTYYGHYDEQIDGDIHQRYQTQRSQENINVQLSDAKLIKLVSCGKLFEALVKVDRRSLKSRIAARDIQASMLRGSDALIGSDMIRNLIVYQENESAISTSLIFDNGSWMLTLGQESIRVTDSEAGRLLNWHAVNIETPDRLTVKIASKSLQSIHLQPSSTRLHLNAGDELQYSWISPHVGYFTLVTITPDNKAYPVVINKALNQAQVYSFKGEAQLLFIGQPSIEYMFALFSPQPLIFPKLTEQDNHDAVERNQWTSVMLQYLESSVLTSLSFRQLNISPIR
ncbi:hypothetical protein [uncultured Shewanella sp.]|uniref:hypothetical protein n=1 Tax=uncultured Shewanella sp. TaxID=173975 RepID=UPI00261EC5B4|nr:hypothetical protein [uncultured Shewanella sp.]